MHASDIPLERPQNIDHGDFASSIPMKLASSMSMSPYEIAYPGGSVEHWNEEAGGVWLHRLLDVYASVIWLNPEAEANWSYSQSNQMIQEMIGPRMYPLTLAGLEDSMKYLAR